MSQDRESFLEEAISKTIDNLLQSYSNAAVLHSELKSVLYQEKNRLTKEPWKSDTPEERIFWSEIKNKFESFEFTESPNQDGCGIGLICFDEA